MPDPDLAIADQPEAQRYEARLGGVLAGYLEYRLAGTRRLILHTEVATVFAGQGVGAALVRHVLDEARAAGRRVTVKCPFARAWLERHPEYADLATPDPRDRRPG